jgi:hypothetical protein
MRRRVRWLSLILGDFDLDCACVLVLMCAAKLTLARGRQVSKAMIRRKRLVLFDILLISLPGR